MALIPANPFPDVPKLPGVPQLRRSLQFPAGPPPALGVPIAVNRLWQALTVTPEWGIFDSDNNRALGPTSILDMGFQKEWQIPTFQVQNGSFASYNKVASPFEIPLRMTKSGSLGDRTQFLNDLERIAESLSLFTILTPERTYLDCNITRFSLLRRGVTGAFFFAEVEVFFREIRQVSPQYASTNAATVDAQNPSAVPPINQGRVSPGAPATSTVFNPETNPGVTP